ncbi:MAG: hypothetical protein K9M19_05780 [Candidatus Marinimicrobia bacterium]|nr:hypothetical protein [Candidatus Neomarinimicrobiota bacterium]
MQNKLIFLLLTLFLPLLALIAQQHNDGTYYYREWSRYNHSSADSLTAFQGKTPYYAVQYDSGRVSVVAYYHSDDSLQRRVVYHYDADDQYTGESMFDGAGNRLIMMTFREQPEDKQLLQQVYGPDFHLKERHFYSRRFFNQQDQQIRYELFAVNGDLVAHVETEWDANGRRKMETTWDDVHGRPIEKLHYDYTGEGSYILEIFDADGKLFSRMTLFHGQKLLTP